MSGKFVRWFSVVALLSSLFIAGSGSGAGSSENVPGFADEILGRWDVTVTLADGAIYPSWFEIRLRTEKQLMARFVGKVGSVRFASNAEYENGKLRLVIPVQYESQKNDLVFEGALVGKKLEGTTTSEDGKPAQWAAVRAPELIPPDAKAKAEITLPLFNGKNLSGWTLRNPDKTASWRVDHGILTNDAQSTDLISREKFQDFMLTMEYMLPEQGNSGVYLRGRYEVQLNDAYGKAIDPLRQGAVYGFLCPIKNPAKKANEWQVLQVTLRGRKVSVRVNGAVVIDGETIPGITGGALDSNEKNPGPLMLQGDHSKVWIRKLEITPLS